MLEDAAAQRADIVPQGLHPGEGGLLQPVHVVGCTAAAALARERAVAVPRVAAQRLAPFDWGVMGSSRMKPWKPQPPAPRIQMRPGRPLTCSIPQNLDGAGLRLHAK